MLTEGWSLRTTADQPHLIRRHHFHRPHAVTTIQRSMRNGSIRRKVPRSSSLVSRAAALHFEHPFWKFTMKQWSNTEISAAETLSLIAEHSIDVIAQVSDDMRFRYISPSSERLFRRSVDDVIGRHISEFVVPEDLPIIAAARQDVLLHSVDNTIVTVRVIRGDGKIIWVEVASRLIGMAPNGVPGDRAVIMRDISDRKALEDELRSMAMRDGLTGLANRRAFDEALESQWQRTSSEKSQMSLLLIDIDHFKEFNDANGHQVGDDCLRSVGAALQTSLDGSGGLLARYGGDELAIVLGGSDSRSAALTAERARAAIEALEIPHGATASGRVTISIGAATAFARDGGSVAMPHALLASADRALYMAKEAGRNCCRTTLLFAKTAT